MTTLPGPAYPVIISMGTGWGQMGLGRGAANHTQLHGQELGFFPQKGVQQPRKLSRSGFLLALEFSGTIAYPGELCPPGRSHPTQASDIPFF